jgi:3-hydroxybutyryl-CoA dehydrogenase
MGAGIIEVFARSGRVVQAVETSESAIRAGHRRVESSLGRAVSGGKLSTTEAESILDRVSFATELESLADCEVIVEAATEDPELKTDLFTRLDKIVTSETAILSTNTSSIPIIQIARATVRPEMVVGLHFFSPVPVMPLVEIVRSLMTSDSVVRRCKDLVTVEMNKEFIVAEDRAGFVVNILLVPYLLSAVRLFEAGHASAADIDKGMRLGAGHPVGPLAVLDYIGIDTLAKAADVLYSEYRDPSFSVPQLLRRMIDAGHTGQKSGRGFFEYGAT